MLSDSLMVLSFVLSLSAAALLAYDAIWAQGARFQRDSARNRRDSVRELIDAEITSINNLPAQYTREEKEEMIRKFKEAWEPKLGQSEQELAYWKDHPKRVHHYALWGLFLLAIASALQCTVYFIKL